jgi:UDP-N-acetylglucosamine diphosphorylase/glucosamine-1-phosphate N-acetyltransferase
MEYILFEDQAWRPLTPFTWLRPVYELLVGSWTLRQRWQSFVGREHLRFTARPELGDLVRERFGERAELPREEAEIVLVNGAWLPPSDVADALVSGLEEGTGWRVDGRVLALRPARPATPERLAETLAALLAGEAPQGIQWREPPADPRCLGHLWELVSWTDEILSADLTQRLQTPYGEGTVVKGEVENPEQVSLGAGVTVGHGALLDASDGPVVLEAGCQVAPFTWVRGPVWAGPGTRLTGERIERSVLGPACRIHGEMESSVVLGYSNKAHEGFVGHSYIGEWVNLGALTTTSDLKNTYGTIRIPEGGETVSSGLMKLGSFLGDHTKTAIGTLLATGCVSGVGSHIFGGSGLTPRWIRSFTWGLTPEQRFHLDRFLVTAETVMSRRGQKMTPALKALIRDVYRRTREEES